MALFLLLVVVALVGVAVYMQLNKAPTEDSVPKRVWASLCAAAVALSAWITSLLQSTPAP